MPLGVILSAGGSAFEQIAEITKGSGIDFTVITSGPCAAEAVAARVGADHVRIANACKTEFSGRAAALASERGLSGFISYFDRLFTRDLFDVVPTFNVHPSLLPVFAGMRPVERAHAARVRLIGCTLHRVDQSIDGGPIVSQIARSVDPDWPLSRWMKIAYLMKVYCGLVWVSRYLQDGAARSTLNASYGLPSHWARSFAALQERENVRVVEFAGSAQ